MKLRATPSLEEGGSVLSNRIVGVLKRHGVRGRRRNEPRQQCVRYQRCRHSHHGTLFRRPVHTESGRNPRFASLHPYSNRPSPLRRICARCSRYSASLTTTYRSWYPKRRPNESKSSKEATVSLGSSPLPSKELLYVVDARFVYRPTTTRGENCCLLGSLSLSW